MSHSLYTTVHPQLACLPELRRDAPRHAPVVTPRKSASPASGSKPPPPPAPHELPPSYDYAVSTSQLASKPSRSDCRYVASVTSLSASFSKVSLSKKAHWHPTRTFDARSSMNGSLTSCRFRQMTPMICQPPPSAAAGLSPFYGAPPPKSACYLVSICRGLSSAAAS